MEEIDYNSNYRLYYEKDPDFFLRVIKQETEPFEFKIHLFSQAAADGKSGSREQMTIMMDYLTQEFDAKEMNTSVISKPGMPAKIKFMFQIGDQDKAYDLYKSLSYSKVFEKTGENVQIYYSKPESVFCEYADKEAEIWYAEQEKAKERK